MKLSYSSRDLSSAILSVCHLINNNLFSQDSEDNLLFSIKELLTKSKKSDDPIFFTNILNSLILIENHLSCKFYMRSKFKDYSLDILRKIIDDNTNIKIQFDWERTNLLNSLENFMQITNVTDNERIIFDILLKNIKNFHSFSSIDNQKDQRNLAINTHNSKTKTKLKVQSVPFSIDKIQPDQHTHEFSHPRKSTFFCDEKNNPQRTINTETELLNFLIRFFALSAPPKRLPVFKEKAMLSCSSIQDEISTGNSDIFEKKPG